jgi:Domain of Unknown Function (DUF928)
MYKIRSIALDSNSIKQVGFPRTSLKYALSIASMTAVSLGLSILPGWSISGQKSSQQPVPDSNINPSWEIAQTFKPPNRGAPAVTEGAGTRGSSCIALSERNKLKPLIPTGNIGLTVSEYPTFFGYIPKSTAKQGEFILRDQNNQLIYRTRFALPSQPGIVSISLPTNRRSLEIGKLYQWTFVLICDPEDRSDSLFSPPAWIERIQPDATLTEQIKNATPETLPAVYAEAGIWFDALATRVKLFTSQPPTEWEQNWEQLLTTAGLQAFVQEPLVDSR